MLSKTSLPVLENTDKAWKDVFRVNWSGSSVDCFPFSICFCFVFYVILPASVTWLHPVPCCCDQPKGAQRSDIHKNTPPISLCLPPSLLSSTPLHLLHQKKPRLYLRFITTCPPTSNRHITIIYRLFSHCCVWDFVATLHILVCMIFFSRGKKIVRKKAEQQLLWWDIKKQNLAQKSEKSVSHNVYLQAYTCVYPFLTDDNINTQVVLSKNNACMTVFSKWYWKHIASTAPQKIKKKSLKSVQLYTGDFPFPCLEDLKRLIRFRSGGCGLAVQAFVNVLLEIFRGHGVISLALAHRADTAKMSSNMLLKVAGGENAGLTVRANLHPLSDGVHEAGQRKDTIRSEACPIFFFKEVYWWNMWTSCNKCTCIHMQLLWNIWIIIIIIFF